jgi:hypothetical protein
MMKKQTTKRMLVTMPQGMYDAIANQSQERETPKSAIIRFAIEQLMRTWGEDVKDDVLWGGARYNPMQIED